MVIRESVENKIYRIFSLFVIYDKNTILRLRPAEWVFAQEFLFVIYRKCSISHSTNSSTLVCTCIFYLLYIRRNTFFKNYSPGRRLLHRIWPGLFLIPSPINTF